MDITNNRVAVYIDGLNLYNGSLARSPYKWLDIKKLCAALLPNEKNIVSISYFTALVKNAGFKDGLQRERQNVYLKALAKNCPDIEIIKGQFIRNKKIMQIAQVTKCGSCEEEHIYKNSKVCVWRNEEKKTDVNLSVRLIHDAWKNKYDHAVVITNDTDIMEAIIAVRENCSPHKLAKKVGFIAPTTVGDRHPARSLLINTDWHKEIKISHLAISQMPDVIVEGHLFKPVEW